MAGPIHTQDAASSARAYTSILGWPVALGHRYRPRNGCTCHAGRQCPEPGAHPLPGPVAAGNDDHVSREFDATPGAALIAPTATFDAMILPRQVGMASMVSIDRYAPVPCLIHGDRAVLLMLPATARYALASGTHPAVELRSGADGWVALPPSHGTRWDTPPWNEQTGVPIPLLHGSDIRPHLADSLRWARSYAPAGEVKP